MIAAHYGRRYSLEGLRERAHLSREGVSMLGISEAAEAIGFRTVGARLTLEELIEAPLPCVVHWNQNHFVVVYKIKNHKIYVADPASGKLTYTQEEFTNCWLSVQNIFWRL
jgi:ATP-binding cassette subfamily B protein